MRNPGLIVLALLAIADWMQGNLDAPWVIGAVIALAAIAKIIEVYFVRPTEQILLPPESGQAVQESTANRGYLWTNRVQTRGKFARLLLG